MNIVNVGTDYEISGFLIDILKHLAREMNFKIHYKIYNWITGDGQEKIDHKDFVLNSGHLALFFNNTRIVVEEPYTHDSMIFLNPPGEPFTALEKMFLPFKIEVWIVMLIVTVASVVVIAIINHLPKKIQNFVYGRNVSMPLLNMIATFMGVSQAQLPRRNFARFLLMSFTVLSLVIRTCYQSELFKYLQTPKVKMEVQTIDEMIAKDFSFAMTHVQFHSIKDSDFIQRYNGKFFFIYCGCNKFLISTISAQRR
jgi:hypothetical protein